MSAFYNDMADGHFENVNERTQKRFLTLSAEAGSESRIIFLFCTSAPKKQNQRSGSRKQIHGTVRRFVKY